MAGYVVFPFNSFRHRPIQQRKIYAIDSAGEFENDVSETSGDIALLSCEFLQECP